MALLDTEAAGWSPGSVVRAIYVLVRRKNAGTGYDCLSDKVMRMV